MVGFEGTKQRLDSEVSHLCRTAGRNFKLTFCNLKREITFYLCILMGLALSNEAVNAYYLPAHMLSLCKFQ